jgi:hypothetical protein
MKLRFKMCILKMSAVSFTDMKLQVCRTLMCLPGRASSHAWFTDNTTLSTVTELCCILVSRFICSMHAIFKSTKKTLPVPAFCFVRHDQTANGRAALTIYLRHTAIWEFGDQVRTPVFILRLEIEKRTIQLAELLRSRIGVDPQQSTRSSSRFNSCLLAGSYFLWRCASCPPGQIMYRISVRSRFWTFRRRNRRTVCPASMRHERCYSSRASLFMSSRCTSTSPAISE